MRNLFTGSYCHQRTIWGQITNTKILPSHETDTTSYTEKVKSKRKKGPNTELFEHLLTIISNTLFSLVGTFIDQ